MAHDAAPQDHSQSQPTHPGRTPHAAGHGLILLVMCTMMPETCWNISLIINIELVASCWFSLFTLCRRCTATRTYNFKIIFSPTLRFASGRFPLRPPTQVPVCTVPLPQYTPYMLTHIILLGHLKIIWWGLLVTGRFFVESCYCRVEYFGRRMTMWYGSVENYIMMSLMICTPHPILFGW